MSVVLSLPPSRRFRLGWWRAVAGGVLLLAAALAVGDRLLFKPGYPRPLSTLSDSGQPVINVAYGRVPPGQTQAATAFVVNSSHDPAVLVSVTLVAIPGTRLPKLTHVALDMSPGMANRTRGWPPDVPIRPFAGARAGHGQTGIVFGVSGNGRGFWATAGLEITYRWHGRTYHVTAWAVNALCDEHRGCGSNLVTAVNRTDALVWHDFSP